MSQIHINYGTVQAQTSNIRSTAASQLQNSKSACSGVQASLSSKDSATNASYIRAIELNQSKAQSATRGITKLLNFISGSAEQMRLEDERLSTYMRTDDRRAL